MADNMARACSKYCMGVSLGGIFGGYYLALKQIQKFQIWIRKIPSDYFFPFVMVCALFLVIIFKQRHRIHLLTGGGRDILFVTHCGVWWKIYRDSEYIEDFPYCPCCEPKRKLVQIQGFPDAEVYRCPNTKTDIKLFAGLPMDRIHILENLHDVYFGSQRTLQFYIKLLDKFKMENKLRPDKEDKDILQKMFKAKPLNKIPKKMRNAILSRHSNPNDVFLEIQRDFNYYKRYLKRRS